MKKKKKFKEQKTKLTFKYSYYFWKHGKYFKGWKLQVFSVVWELNVFSNTYFPHTQMTPKDHQSEINDLIFFSKVMFSSLSHTHNLCGKSVPGQTGRIAKVSTGFNGKKVKGGVKSFKLMLIQGITKAIPTTRRVSCYSLSLGNKISYQPPEKRFLVGTNIYLCYSF